MAMNLGLIGVGIMGVLVAEALAKAGHRVVIFDKDQKAVQRAMDVGAEAADSPKAVASKVDITILLLPSPPIIDAVVNGSDGLLAAAQPGHTIIDMSTVDPATTRRMGEKAAEKEVQYLDSPILGRPSAWGYWVLPVGGTAEVYEQCLPVLQLLAREVIHVGPLGAGHTLKLLNALMFSAINAMTAEMMAVSTKAGLSPEVLFNTISASEAATVSGLFKEVGSKIVARDFDPTFSIDLLCKDNGLAISMAESVGAPPLLARMIQTVNELGNAQGFGAEDTSALFKVYENLLSIQEK